MAAISTLLPTTNSNPKFMGFAPSQGIQLFSSLSLKSTLFYSNFAEKLYSPYLATKTRSDRFGVVPRCASSSSFDVVIIGAGIIGLTIARQFLIGSDLSVAVVDKALPCSGATGAGQGYIWMSHKTPGSDVWELGMRSQTLWEMLAESIQEQGMNPLEVLGWKKTGSLLVGRTPKDSALLVRIIKELSQAGLRAEYLSSTDLLFEEPALKLGNGGGAAFLPDDCQLDAHLTVSYIEKANRCFASEGRYAEFYNHPVTHFLKSGNNGELEAVQTSKNILYGKKAIIIAAGCWSGSLMLDLIRESDIALDVPVEPRKGHLLVLENFSSFHLNHGLMEVGYVGHQVVTPSPGVSDLGPVHHDQTLSISMTATMDYRGNLLLGSSRQFAGFDIEVDETIIDLIWDRAGEFFPMLRELRQSYFSSNRKVRVGLRPYMPDGKPMIGPVPGLSKMFLATGHEGGGLSMALGTAEMVADMVLGNPGKVDCTPFAVQAR